MCPQLDFIDSFADDNPFDFAPDELEIVRSWKHLVAGSFFILRYLKKHTIFLSQGTLPRAYGVLALNDSFEEIAGPHLPVVVKTVLLPFQRRIIYDGLMTFYAIRFGGGARRNLNNVYAESSARFGVITSLPVPEDSKAKSDVERLKSYLRNAASREAFSDEIFELISKSRECRVVFHQEMGKLDARHYGKRLREAGFANVWFGIWRGLIVASGKTKKDLERNLEEVLPPRTQEYVYRFHLK